MAYKTSGSNALSGDSSSSNVGAENAKVISSSSDGSTIKIRFAVDTKPELKSVQGGNATQAPQAASQSTGTTGNSNNSTTPSSSSSSIKTANTSNVGFNSSSSNSSQGSTNEESSQSSNNGAIARDDDFAASDEKGSDYGDDDSQTGVADDDLDGQAAQGDQEDLDAQDNQEDHENQEGQDGQNTEEGDQQNAAGGQQGDNKDDQDNKEGKNSEEKDSEGKEGGANGEDQNENDPALTASATTAAALGGAEMADEAADNLPKPETQAQPEQSDLGDSGTAAAAGTNPALNQEAADQSRESAKKDLRNSEKNAAADAPQKSGDKEAKNKEDNPDSGFKNSAVGKAGDIKKLDPRWRIINKLRQFGPVGAIAALILGVGFTLAGMQSFLPFSIAELLRVPNDTMSVPTVSRAQRIFIKQLAQKAPNDVADANNYNVSNKQRSNLARNGIYIVNSELTGEQMALYDDGSGTLKVVAADDASAASLKGKIVNTDDTSAAMLQRKISTGELNAQLQNRYGKSGFAIDTENVDTFKARMADDTSFEQNFTKGSKTWGSSIAEWFDIRTAQFLNRNFITRNLFKKYINRSLGTDTDADADGGTTTRNRTLADVVEEAETAKRKSSSGGGVEFEEQKFKDTDADDGGEGEDAGKVKARDDDTNIKSKVDFNDNDDDANTKTVAVNNAKKSLGSIAKTAASKITSGACMMLNFIGGASLVAAGYNIAQVLPVIASFFETTDKIKSGNGDAPINEVATALVTPAAGTVQEAEGEYTDNVDDITESNLKTTTTKEETALQSEAMSASLTGTKIDPSDPLVSSFNVGSLTASVGNSGFLSKATTILADLSVGVGMFRACSIFKLASNAVSVASGVVTVIGAILGSAAGPAGALAGAGIAQLIFKAGAKIGKAVIATGAVSLISKLLVPRLATVFMRKIKDALVGGNYGTALVFGAAIYLGRNHLFGGGSPGSREQYVTFATKQQEQIAKDAEYERANRSPFDYTSQYTFAGSILRQLAVLSSMGSAPTKIFSTIGTLTKNSIVSMMPTAAADANEIASNMMTEEEFEATCPMLASIGAYGDAFCNPYIISDFSTMDTDPEDVKNQISGQFNGSDIIEGSELSKYIDYCSGRTSNFGIVDGNIANQFTVGSTGNNYGDALVGVIPIYGDMLDIMTEKNKLENAGWITGEECVASNDPDSNWGSQTRYYQRYVEDERLKESIYGSTSNGGTGYVSPVTAYIEKRNEENPVDNSAEGVLARYSGLTKDQVIAVLDYMEYQNYIADYDPSERFAFGEGVFKPTPDIYFDMPETGDTIFATVFRENIVYADIRNRLTTTA